MWALVDEGIGHVGYKDALNQVPSDDALVIDCDLCDYSGTQACDDCMVTYLCREDRSSVVVELSEVRALRKLSRAGLVPELKLRNSMRHAP